MLRKIGGPPHCGAKEEKIDSVDKNEGNQPEKNHKPVPLKGRTKKGGWGGGGGEGEGGGGVGGGPIDYGPNPPENIRQIQRALQKKVPQW